jgi:ABC-2 type transport system ATP-binding protein/lipopolysaccharide transport system ATP-binding protein
MSPVSDCAVEVVGVSKTYVLEHNRVMSLKGRFIGCFKKRWRPRRELFTALDDVNLTVRRGQALGLMGANGSGKSTLLQLIAGIFKPTQGVIRVRGRIAPMIQLGVGFNVELTGEENIYLNASLFGFGNRTVRQRMDQIIEFSELARFIDSPLKHYSSGMQMRLGFAIAVHLDPDILLADEILAVGDASFQKKCLARINELREGGMTLILVSHTPAQVAQFCDHYVELAYGRVVASGPVSDLQNGSRILLGTA